MQDSVVYRHSEVRDVARYFACDTSEQHTRQITVETGPITCVIEADITPICKHKVLSLPLLCSSWKLAPREITVRYLQLLINE
jgi:hypothetical protein